MFTEGNATDSAKQCENRWDPGLPQELAVKSRATFSLLFVTVQEITETSKNFRSCIEFRDILIIKASF